MMKALPIVMLLLIGCASQKSTSTGTTQSDPESGNTRTTRVDYIDGNTYLLTVVSDDATYGYKESNPIKVGGKSEGPLNERRFLNGLLGPNGEPLQYYRVGSCCPFKTPNGFSGGGMLDRYEVSWGSEKRTIFINMYDEGDLKIPVGFTAKKK